MKRTVLFVFVVAVTSICSGQWLERQVVLGDTFGSISLVAKGGIVVNPISGNVYIESDPVQIFNPITMEKLRGPGVGGVVAFCSASGKGYVLGDTAVILDAAADTAIGITVLPFAPYFHAYSPTSNRLYLGEQNGETLLVFDPDGDSVLKSIGIGAWGCTLLWDSVWNRVYVGPWQDPALLKVLDCATDSFVGSVQLGSGPPRSFVLSYVSRKLYCCTNTDVCVVSTDSLKPIGVVPGLDDPSPDRFVYSPVTDRLYWGTGPFTDTVAVFDCQDDTIRTRFAAWAPILAASTLSGRVYVGVMGSSHVLVVDTSDLVVDSVPLPTAPIHSGVALTFRPDRNELYGVSSADLVYTIDASVDTLSSTLNYAAYAPRQMVHNPAGSKLYLLCPAHGEVLVVDSTFGTPKHILGGVTNNSAFPVLNQALNRLYVADDDVLRVIDCNSDSLLGSKAMYGINEPIPVMVPYLNKLYVFFSTTGTGDSVYAYDCLRDAVFSVFHLTAAVPCAVYDPRSNRVFFACEDAPTVRALDPVTDSVVKTFDLVGGSSNGRMMINPDLGRLYYTDQSPDLLFTIDVLTDSVISSESLPGNVYAMFLNRRLGKLYMCSRGAVLVFDCAQGTIVDTVYAGFLYTGLMNDRNDKLYLRYGAVVDCRYDSVVTMLPDSLNPRCMAWDAIDNRVFQATASWLYVYRDDPYGVEEQKVGNLGPMLTVLGNPARNAVRLRLQIPRGQTGRLTLYDVAGRQVRSLSVARTSTLRLDLKSMSAGVYFVALEAGRTRITDKVVVEH
jgi:DNA-binding beta-propeller fold protein YncE